MLRTSRLIRYLLTLFAPIALATAQGACSSDSAADESDAPQVGAGGPATPSEGGNGGRAAMTGAAGASGDGQAGAQPTAGSSGLPASDAGSVAPPEAGGSADADGGVGDSGPRDAGSGAGGDGGSTPVMGMPQQRSLANLLSARSEHGVAALGGRVYMVGGLGANGNRVEVYDPATDQWTGRANLPMSMEHPNLAATNGKLYVVGGGLFSTTGRTFEYDPEADGWTERAGMPAGTERASACVVGFENKVYVFGGARARSGTVTQASVFDTLENRWEALPDVPQPPRQHCGAAEVDGILYIVAGRTSFPTPFTPVPLAFDPATGMYTPGAPMPTPRGGVAAAALNGRIYVFGGEGNSANATGVFADVEAYDPRSDSWERLPDMQVPRHGFGAATVGGRIYLPGGAEGQGGSNISSANTAFYYE